MTVKIDADFIVATCAVLTLVGGAWAAVTIFVINAIVARQNAKQLILINGTYIRSQGGKITGREIEDKLKEMRLVQKQHGDKLIWLEAYCRENIHFIANILQVECINPEHPGA